MVLKVNLLNHLKTRYRDEAVKGYTYATHNASGDGVKEGNEGRDEGNENCHNSGGRNSNNRSVTGNCNTANRLTVGGVGASAEESANDRAYAVTEKSSVETWLLEKIGPDDSGKVLVVSDMLSKYNECNGNVSYCNGCNVRSAKVVHALESLKEGELGNGKEG